MSERPPQEKIDKLPKWAQYYIADLERERREAVRTLMEFRDNDTKSAFHFVESPCIGEGSGENGRGRGPSFITRYVQAYTIFCEHAGVRLRVSTNEDDRVILSYEDHDRMGRQVCLVPTGYQNFELMAKEAMRQ